MAYDIPVLALILDQAAAAAVINEPSDFFGDESNDRYDGVERLIVATGCNDITYFASEDESVYEIGLHIESVFCIYIGPKLAKKALAIKAIHPHPLIQTARLAVVTQFN